MLTAVNCGFWVVSCFLSWNRLIPEPFIALAVVVALIFSIPFGLCSLPFLVVSELHDTGWRIALYGSLTLANSIAWAWVVDWLWKKVAGNPSPRGFPIEPRDNGGAAAE
jgi:hypothetical protein